MNCTKMAPRYLKAIFAERTRFELVVQNNPYGSLANCWFQPLTHLSGIIVRNSRQKLTGLQRYHFFIKSQGMRPSFAPSSTKKPKYVDETYFFNPSSTKMAGFVDGRLN